GVLLHCAPAPCVSPLSLHDALPIFSGRIDEAIAILRKALEIKPDYADAYSNLSDALLARHRTVEAIACGEQAIRLKPDDAPAHRSEEHTSELQSRGHLVCRLLLEKK